MVASEVRNLAQRSASATIQKVVASVRSVTELMADISRVSAAQTIGLGQVNHALGDIDRLAQQNSALVEKASAAAQE